MTVHVVLAGGGTAGHVEPALATADALLRLQGDTEVTFLGTTSGLEARLVPDRGGRLVTIPRVPLPRRPTADLLAVPFRLRGAVKAVERVLAETGAQVVVGFGGYVAMPAYLAARSARIPIVVHESNARPGLANRIAARFAAAVATGYPDSGLPGARHLGTPLRTAITTLDRAAERDEARAFFGLAPDRRTVLVFGGSQGARSINEAAAAAAPALAAAGVQVLHATGAGHVEAVRSAVGDVPSYRVVPYLDRMDLAYAAADVAVCRAGAMTCTELAAVGLPAVYVPLPHGNGEQRLNALPVVDAGGGILIADAELTGNRLAATLLPLLADSAGLAAMSDAAAGFGRRDGDVALAQLVLDTARGER
ncbi:MAG: UDP-N-acetylglucosamine--N-acetylmuramyl-(pentapeptide) pyrophosphoryl-undecaprenol [Frankiaceae bacterium]|jgi:UDP-N-acetylglucosamine--N-acetylmuramyl-(pentapeptide) pyrophosphoryl-undecaprenol N-acetylglucosamine transferase|nr:UDP-N-acetylglucosamine--N-acetylmuramyl-(pentapeptide) pyrophosphoryl-undecaprenol [Frankiaceae bacterium]MDQ1725965.1 UDP-N-acetylglucosamine--N-acetylmuramyl-(pentapeptide) pyrophosphoryl-undecaprenol [Frankiaceae bacterium]